MNQRAGFARLQMASFGQNIKKASKLRRTLAEMEINWTEKLKPDLKSLWNSESTNECPTQSIDHEHYLIGRSNFFTRSTRWTVPSMALEMSDLMDFICWCNLALLLGSAWLRCREMTRQAVMTEAGVLTIVRSELRAENESKKLGGSHFYISLYILCHFDWLRLRLTERCH